MNSEQILLFLIYSLAVWRTTSLLVIEDGPYLIFIKLRILLGTDYGIRERKATPQEVSILPKNMITTDYRTEISKAISCIWCTSVWVSFAFGIGHVLEPELLKSFALLMAMSAVAIKVDGI